MRRARYAGLACSLCMHDTGGIATVWQLQLVPRQTCDSRVHMITDLDVGARSGLQKKKF